MGIFDKLFGRKSPEQMQAEADRIRREKEELSAVRASLLPKYPEPADTVARHEKVLALLSDGKYHPVSRLALAGDTGEFDRLIDDHIQNLISASKGDSAALAEAKKNEEFAKKILPGWIKRTESSLKSSNAALEMLETRKAKGGKWVDLKEKAKRDLDIALQRRKLWRDLLEGRPHEDDLWKRYYQERFAALRNESIDRAARMVWTNSQEKDKIIKEYLDQLNLAVSGFFLAGKLEDVEAHMDSVIKGEAERIARDYWQFFTKGPGVEQSLEM